MDASEWRRAIDAGEVQHDLNPITIEYDGHVGVFHVSTDAVRVDGVRHTCSPIAAQQAADALGCLLLTSKLYEERWRQSSVVIPPCPGDVVRDDAHVHSAKVDKEVQIATGLPGDWIVADVGKAWIIDPKCTTKRAVNHGWIVGASVQWGSDGRPYWKGIPVSRTSGIDGQFIIQNRGAAHGLNHEDYSQVLLVVDGMCEVDGVPMRTADVYRDPELCGLVTFNRMPLEFTRQPGVQLVAPRDADPPPASTTDPAPFDMTLGERAVGYAVSERDDGVREVPDGSNNGPRIREYLEPCVREGQPGLGKYLAEAGANWCAAFFWFCQSQVLTDGDPTYPYRCSGLESENDAKERGAWREVGLVLDGKWEPAEGDGVILKRGSLPWQRHMCRFMRRVNENFFETIGGNEGNTIKVTLRRYDDPALLGFIAMPRDDVGIDVAISRPLIVQPGEQMALAHAIDDQNDGEKAV